MGFAEHLQKAVDLASQPPPPGSGAARNIASGIERGVAQPLVHPLQTLKSLGETLIPGGQMMEGPKATFDSNPIVSGIREAKQIGVMPMLERAVGSFGGQAAMGGAIEPALSGVKAIRNAAIGDPDAAAVRGLKVPSGSPKMQRTISSVQTARPYLQGVQSQADLQARIPAAKAEIWGPYQQAVEAGKDLPAKGPDGPTTVGALEQERLQLSALNRALKMREPEAIQLAQQKGMNQAQLLDREKAVQAALDPELTKMGIKPQEIRKTFGSVAQIGAKVSGKSNIIEPPQAYGFSKLKDLSLSKPLSNIPTIASAGRDIAAGRYTSASPVDTGIREGFRTASPRPDLGRLNTTLQPPPPRNLLGPGARPMPAPPEVGGTPAGYRPPPFHYDTDAMRTGRLLNPPPTQLGGAVEGPKGQPFRYDTTPMRAGRILPPPADYLPMTSHEGFPEQLPNARLIRPPKTIEGKR
jgi:hypothetical protein